LAKKSSPIAVKEHTGSKQNERKDESKKAECEDKKEKKVLKKPDIIIVNSSVEEHTSGPLPPLPAKEPFNYVQISPIPTKTGDPIIKSKHEAQQLQANQYEKKTSNLVPTTTTVGMDKKKAKGESQQENNKKKIDTIKETSSTDMTHDQDEKKMQKDINLNKKNVDKKEKKKMKNGAPTKRRVIPTLPLPTTATSTITTTATTTTTTVEVQPLLGFTPDSVDAIGRTISQLHTGPSTEFQLVSIASSHPIAAKPGSTLQLTSSHPAAPFSSLPPPPAAPPPPSSSLLLTSPDSDSLLPSLSLSLPDPSIPFSRTSSAASPVLLSPMSCPTYATSLVGKSKNTPLAEMTREKWTLIPGAVKWDSKKQLYKLQWKWLTGPKVKCAPRWHYEEDFIKNARLDKTLEIVQPMLENAIRQWRILNPNGLLPPQHNCCHYPPTSPLLLWALSPPLSVSSPPSSVSS
jgi:hypothetical protein